MKVIETIEGVRSAVGAARRAGASVALVPTMGALHDGHYSLIDAASAECDFVVVSIFVNPTQFGAGEDLDSYPRPLDDDLAGCEARGADVVFVPDVEMMYPRPPLTEVSVRELSERLCGRSRPGHFTGVCTVVAKLLNIASPDRAYFGAKDYQQSVIVRRMVEDLNFPVEIVVCPTTREPSGLARSSRNAYLDVEQMHQAPALHEALAGAERMIRESHPPVAEVLDAIRHHIAERAPDGRIEYVEIVDPWELTPVESTERAVLIAIAVRLGDARLIDNIRVGAERRSS